MMSIPKKPSDCPESDDVNLGTATQSDIDVETRESHAAPPVGETVPPPVTGACQLKDAASVDATRESAAPVTGASPPKDEDVTWKSAAPVTGACPPKDEDSVEVTKKSSTQVIVTSLHTPKMSAQSLSFSNGKPQNLPSECESQIPSFGSSASSLPTERSVCRLCLLTQEEAGEKLIRLLCLCKGSVKFVHRSCAQRWIRTRGNRSDCEMCGGQMIAETRLEICCRRIATRWRNASYKETVLAISLLAFLFWLFSYCVYLFTQGLTEVLTLNNKVTSKGNVFEGYQESQVYS